MDATENNAEEVCEKLKTKLKKEINEWSGVSVAKEASPDPSEGRNNGKGWVQCFQQIQISN